MLTIKSNITNAIQRVGISAHEKRRDKMHQNAQIIHEEDTDRDDGSNTPLCVEFTLQPINNPVITLAARSTYPLHSVHQPILCFWLLAGKTASDCFFFFFIGIKESGLCWGHNYKGHYSVWMAACCVTEKSHDFYLFLVQVHLIFQKLIVVSAHKNITWGDQIQDN